MRKKQRRYTLADIVPRTTLDDLFREQEESFVQESEAEIDKRLEDLEELIGRELTGDERFAILTIVEKQSLKDDEGYIIDYLPFDYAWKIYQAKHKV
jgi:CYTH domain-containing protein